MLSRQEVKKLLAETKKFIEEETDSPKGIEYNVRYYADRPSSDYQAKIDSEVFLPKDLREIMKKRVEALRDERQYLKPETIRRKDGSERTVFRDLSGRFIKIWE